MINFQEEIKRFRPSLEVENIESTITGIDLTDMNDLMMELVQRASQPETPPRPVSSIQRVDADMIDDEL